MNPDFAFVVNPNEIIRPLKNKKQILGSKKVYN